MGKLKWGVGGFVCSKEVSDRYELGLWKAVRKLWVIINGRVSFSVSNGGKVKFWKDK